MNFNTSHVTVYRITLGEIDEYLEFQYISCYCLSYHTDLGCTPV